MKKLLAFLITALLMIPPAYADQPLTPDDMKFGEWMTYYYVKKDVDGVDGYLHWLENGKILDKHESALLPVSSFLTTLFTANPDKVDGWLKLQSYHDKAKEAMQQVGQKAFFKKQNGWQDSTVTAEQAKNAISIKQFSKEYFDLAASHGGQMAQYMAFTEPVLVNIGPKTYRIEP